MSIEFELNDFRKLLRTYGVLAGTCDAERAIVGRVSRAWIASEVEQVISLASIPNRFFYTSRGREVLAGELFPGVDVDPSTIIPEELNIPERGSSIFINSNRIPKLEPRINGAILAGNLLLGVKLYGQSGKDKCDIDNDWIIATMLQDTLGKKHRYTSFRPEKAILVDDHYILTYFGQSVLSKTNKIKNALARFMEVIKKPKAPLPRFSPEISNSIVSIVMSRLRLSARAAGDGVLGFAGPVQIEQLKSLGIDVTAEFPERPFLESDFNTAERSLLLEGVDFSALKEPMQSTLMTAVKDALDDPVKRFRLSGRRGKAVHDVHMNMPVMEYYVAAEAPNTLATLHLASLEMMRYLEKGRRKSYNTMLAHALRLTAIAESTLGRSLEPGIATIALLHDVVEDGSKKITGYDQSLQKIMFRFGGPIAAMVSEVTDSSTKKDASQKALKTLNHPELMMPEKQYNTGRLNKMALKATDKSHPYTLAGIVVKLIDTSVSFEEGIRDPDLMSGWWKHSGARIYWAERVRGEIVMPLIERLVLEIKSGRESDKILDIAIRSQMRGGLALISTILDYSDLYAAQNLAILAFEHGLNVKERDQLIRDFFNPNISTYSYMNDVLNVWLTEARLDEQIKLKHVPRKSFVALYAYEQDQNPGIDTTTFKKYLTSARRRVQIRQELGLYTAKRRVILQKNITDVVYLYDYRTGKP